MHIFSLPTLITTCHGGFYCTWGVGWRTSEYWINYRAPWVSSALSIIEGVHIGARALHVLNLIWFGWIARLSQWGGGGQFPRSNDIYLPSHAWRKGVGGRHPVGRKHPRDYVQPPWTDFFTLTNSSFPFHWSESTRACVRLLATMMSSWPL